MSIAVVVLTHNRAHLLEKCVANVLNRVSPRTREIVIWNNASTDDTASYLESLDGERFRVVHASTNIGQNAYDRAFATTTADYLIEVDDDIIDAPANWDDILLESFLRLEQFGYLAANLVNNPNDTTARIMYGANAHLYRVEVINGINVKVGPTGGGCSLTSRKVYDRVGGFGENSKSVFWLEDEAYIRKVMKLGLRAGYLNDLEVLHAGGEYYARSGHEKNAYWSGVHKRTSRKNAMKRRILRLPLARRLNERYEWFVPPEDSAI